jgi:hypothetical protein
VRGDVRTFARSAAAGMSQEWIEYQVMSGRKVVRRCGSEEAAKEAVAELERGEA